MALAGRRLDGDLVVAGRQRPEVAPVGVGHDGKLGDRRCRPVERSGKHGSPGNRTAVRPEPDAPCPAVVGTIDGLGDVPALAALEPERLADVEAIGRGLGAVAEVELAEPVGLGAKRTLFTVGPV